MTPAVRIQGLDHRWPDGTPALRAVDLEIAAGERVALLGANGAGKSTLLLHLNGLLPERLPRQPQVWIHGRPLGTDTAPAIRADVGLLFQDPDDQLFGSTVAEDVAFGPRQAGLPATEVDARVAEALARTRLQDLADRPPARLSRGEKTRACLAGLLACRPRVLALDEPTAHLDPRGRRELLALLQVLPGTHLVATHDLEFALLACTRAIVLGAGAVVADGPVRTVLADEALMTAHGLEVPPSLRSRP